MEEAASEAAQDAVEEVRSLATKLMNLNVCGGVAGVVELSSMMMNDCAMNQDDEETKQ